MAKKNRYTPVQQRILGVLLDEKPHTKAELEACLPDEGECDSRLSVQLTGIRVVLRNVDRDIITRKHENTYYYQLIYLPYPFTSSSESAIEVVRK